MARPQKDRTQRGLDLAPALQHSGSELAEVWARTRRDNFGVMGPTVDALF
jgi:hypothetical protein